jgi:MFS family permease
VRRSVGVTIVGILILVLSSLMLMGAVLDGVFMLSVPMTTTQTIPNAPPPEQMRAMSILDIGFFGLMAAFGVAIGVGILRLWSWARYTAIVIGFLVTGICVFSAVIFFIIPLPETPGLAGGFRIGMALFNLFWAVLYAVVSIYLLRASVGGQFRQAGLAQNPAVERESKPLAVLTVAGLAFFGLLCMPFFVFMDYPVLLFGTELTGGKGKMAIVIWMLLLGMTAVALVRRVKNALWAAVGLHGVGTVSELMCFRDGVLEHYFQELPKYGGYGPQMPADVMRLAMAMGILAGLVPIALLLIGKTKYFAWCERRQLVAPPQA